MNIFSLVALRKLRKKGVAGAIADLIAAGITPVYSSTLTKATPLQNPKIAAELASPPTDK